MLMLLPVMLLVVLWTLGACMIGKWRQDKRDYWWVYTVLVGVMYIITLPLFYALADHFGTML